MCRHSAVMLKRWYFSDMLPTALTRRPVFWITGQGHIRQEYLLEPPCILVFSFLLPILPYYNVTPSRVCYRDGTFRHVINCIDQTSCFLDTTEGHIRQDYVLVPPCMLVFSFLIPILSYYNVTLSQ